jgi:glyoxylate reductase
MKPVVFVAQPIPEPALDIMREVAEVRIYPHMDRQISVAELAWNARSADYLYVMHETKVTAEVLGANPDLKGIGALAKFDPDIDMAAARARRIPIVVENLADMHGADVNLDTADLTVAMIVSLAYRMVESDRYTRSGKFRQEQTMALMGVGCTGRTVGLIGFGKVAEFMAPRLAAFAMKLLYTKRSRLAAEREASLGLEWAEDLDDLLRRSDFVCIACDYNPSTHKLIGSRELALMQRSAYLVNTARGRIVDEPALIAALEDGTIAGAALDVYWNEPPHTDMPMVPEALCRMENVILTPHNGGATWDGRSRRTASVARGLVDLIAGRRPAALLNPEIYEDAKG